MVFSKQDAFLTGYHDLKRTSSRDLRRPGHASTRHFGPPSIYLLFTPVSSSMDAKLHRST